MLGIGHGWSANEASRSLSTRPNYMPARSCSSASSRNIHVRRCVHCKMCTCCRRRLALMPRSALSAQTTSAGYLCEIYTQIRHHRSEYGINAPIHTEVHITCSGLPLTLNNVCACLRFVSASRLIRMLKREVPAEALPREESSVLQTLACSCCSSAREIGPSASQTFPARPRVRPLTYLGLPCESTHQVRSRDSVSTTRIMR